MVSAQQFLLYIVLFFIIFKFFYSESIYQVYWTTV